MTQCRARIQRKSSGVTIPKLCRGLDGVHYILNVSHAAGGTSARGTLRRKGQSRPVWVTITSLDYLDQLKQVLAELGWKVVSTENCTTRVFRPAGARGGRCGSTVRERGPRHQRRGRGDPRRKQNRRYRNDRNRKRRNRRF